MVEYKDIIPTIKKFSNLYEDNAKIITSEIKEVWKKGDVALIEANKADNTKTLFLAFGCSRKKENWLFLAASENQMENLSFIYNYYKNLNKDNSQKRWQIN